MKNKDVLNLKQALVSVGNLSGVKFAYAIARNKKFVDSEIESIQESIKPTEAFKEYDNARVELCKEMADKDEKGKPKFENNQYVITENKDEFDKKFEKLKEKYQKDIDERVKTMKEFNEVFLESESKFVPYKVKLEDVPKEIIASQMNSIIELIEE